MAELPKELKKLKGIATDLEVHADLRTKAVGLLGNMGSREALLALLELAGNEQLTRKERELALKHAKGIIKAGH